MDYEHELRACLEAIDRLDPSKKRAVDPMAEYLDDNKRYALRNDLVHDAIFIARKLGYEAGFIIHDPITDLISRPDIEIRTPYTNFAAEYKPSKWDKRWGVVAIIELPTGQISWHMDSGGLEYDGHSDDTKWERVNTYLQGSEEYGEPTKSVSGGTEGI
jgi:hypothetical protein